MVIDKLAADNNLKFSDAKWQAQTVRTTLWSQQVILAKPQTYMNESGRAVRAITSYYKLPPENIIVVHDDLDLETFKSKLVTNRGAGGHNGISSMINHLGSKAFSRIRVGIGRPPSESMPVSKFVLSKFSVDQQDELQETICDLVQYVRIFVEEGPVKAMNQINRTC